MRAHVLLIGILAAAGSPLMVPLGEVKPAAAAESELSVEAIAKKALPAIVTIVVKNAQGQMSRRAAASSWRRSASQRTCM